MFILSKVFLHFWQFCDIFCFRLPRDIKALQGEVTLNSNNTFLKIDRLDYRQKVKSNT